LGFKKDFRDSYAKGRSGKRGVIVLMKRKNDPWPGMNHLSIKTGKGGGKKKKGFCLFHSEERHPWPGIKYLYRCLAKKKGGKKSRVITSQKRGRC